MSFGFTEPTAPANAAAQAGIATIGSVSAAGAAGGMVVGGDPIPAFALDRSGIATTEQKRQNLAHSEAGPVEAGFFFAAVASIGVRPWLRQEIRVEHDLDERKPASV